MIDMQRVEDAIKMLFGSAVSIAGGAWTWIGTNHQSIGALCAILGAVYATIYFTAWVRHGRK